MAMIKMYQIRRKRVRSAVVRLLRSVQNAEVPI